MPRKSLAANSVDAWVAAPDIRVVDELPFDTLNTN